MSDEALEFFNSLSGKLEIELTEEPARVAPNLDNLKAPPGARVAKLSLRLRVFLPEEEEEGVRELTPEEWDRVILTAPSIRMRGERGESPKVVEYRAPDGEGFTTRALAAAVEETERQGRGDTEWFGGIDVHHVFFEGIELADDGVWVIGWGS